MFFISSVDCFEVGVTSTSDGSTQLFDRVSIEVFLRNGNAVLGAIPYYDSSRQLSRYVFVPVVLTDSRQVRDEVEFGFEGIRSSLVPDTLFDFVRLYNFKSLNKGYCSEFLVLMYLLQVYNDVSVLLRSCSMFVSIPFWSYYKSINLNSMSFRLSCDVFHISNLIGGYLDGDKLVISFERLDDNKKMCICLDLRTLVVSLKDCSVVTSTVASY